jgi:hypothetical protein
MAILLLYAALLPSALAYLQVIYPLNQQFPSAAHVDIPYQFQFAPTTFQSDASKIQYSLVGGPSWLSLDSTSRTLSGTPRASDVGEIAFTIAAAAAAGAVANMASKLLVTADNQPETNVNITQVLSTAGQLSGPTILTIGPSKPFNVSFPTDSFKLDGKPLTYYATLSDHTPLPAWISFDASSLHFAGTTPSTPFPQTFDVVLIACGTPGYAVSSLPFTLAVSNHCLSFEPSRRALNMSKEGHVHITDVQRMLTLDGTPIKDQDFHSITAQLPSWLAMDNQSFAISGTAPSGTMAQDIVITAKDQSGDVAQLHIHLASTSKLFASEIGQVKAIIGEHFEYHVPQGILLNSNEEDVSVDLSSLTDYLHFDSASLTISGSIPDEFTPQDVQCKLTTSSSDGVTKDTMTFRISISAAATNGTTAKTNSAALYMDERRAKRRKLGIIVGTIIGAGLCLLFLITFTVWLRRRGQTKSYVSPKLARSPRKSEISRPVYTSWVVPGFDVHVHEDVEKGKDDFEPPLERTPEQPPKLDTQLPGAELRDSLSASDPINEVGDVDKWSWVMPNDIAPSQHPHSSMKIATDLAKRSSQDSETSRKHKRRTTVVYQDQIHRSSGLPVNRRITGAGHGRHTCSPSRSNTNFSRSSLRRPLSTASSYGTTRCTSTLSTAPSAFPQPPVAWQRVAQVTTPTEGRQSMRIVPSSTRNSLAERRTLDEKRLSYIRKRASAHSPFFSAGGARALSSTYKSPPAFIAEAHSSPQIALSPTTRNTIVRPDDEVVEGRGKELPQILQISKSLSNVSPETPKGGFPGSLRQNRVTRPATATPNNHSLVEKSYVRPGTTIISNIGIGRRRVSTRDSLRACGLITSLNNLTCSGTYPYS